jgi:hypothetical protein
MLFKSSTFSDGRLREDDETFSTWRVVSLSPYSERTPMSIDGKVCAGNVYVNAQGLENLDLELSRKMKITWRKIPIAGERNIGIL